jgi:O-antigen/teichoic acid export membrane protein
MADEGSSASQSILKGSGIIFAGLVLELGIGFVAQIIIARTLGRMRFGEVSIGVTVLTIGSTLALIGTHTGLGRFLPRYDDLADRRGVLLTALWTGMGLSILVAMSVLLFAEPIATIVFDAPEMAPVLRVFGLAIPFLSLIKLASGGMQGVKLASPRVLIRNVTLPVTRFGLIIVVVALGLGEVGIAGAYLFAHVAGGLLGIYYLWKHTSLFASIKPAYKHRELIAFSGPLVVSSAMGIVFSDLDTLLLGYFVSNGEVGIYRVVYPLAELLLVFLNSISFMFLPVLSELHAEGNIERMNRIYQVITKWLLVLTFPILITWVLFPRIVIRTFFGSEYVTGGQALAVLAIGFFIHAVTGLNSNTITSIGETKFIPMTNLIAAVTNFGLNMVLIPRYSFLGAAVATTVSYTVLNLLFSGLLYRMTGITPIGRPVVRIGVAVSLMTAVLYIPLQILLKPTIESVVIAGFVFVPIYVATVFVAGGLGEEEKRLINEVEDQLGINFGRLRNR